MPALTMLSAPKIICPQCQGELQRIDRSWRCDSGHCFDIAKQGYSNLLLVQNKKSLAPGDDAEMVAARTRFLNQGFYQPLAAAIARQALQLTPANGVIIDAGCGEGYYTDALAQAFSAQQQAVDITGIDISKFAVKAAARRSKALASESLRWFVANSSQLPVAATSCDTVLSLFSPLPAESFRRALKAGGTLIVASTGSQHLMQLRERLYEHVDDKVLDPAKALSEHFSPGNIEHIRFEIELGDSETIMDLLSMTPHYWRAKPERKEALKKLDKLSVSADIQLQTFTVI